MKRATALKIPRACGINHAFVQQSGQAGLSGFTSVWLEFPRFCGNSRRICGNSRRICGNSWQIGGNSRWICGNSRRICQQRSESEFTPGLRYKPRFCSAVRAGPSAGFYVGFAGVSAFLWIFTADLRECTADLRKFTADLRKFTADLPGFTAYRRSARRIHRRSAGACIFFSIFPILRFFHFS